MNLLAFTVIGFFITLVAVFVLRSLAKSINRVDRPGGQKTDHGNVLLVGGFAMFIGLVAGLGIAHPQVAVRGSLVGVTASVGLTRA